MIRTRRNIRVTHVITRLIVGGAQENTVSTVLGLRRDSEFDVNLISGPPEPEQGSLESAFHSCPEALMITPLLVRPIKPLVDFKALRDLSKIFRRQQPVIVHTHSGKAGILGRWAAWLQRVPIIVHTIHGPSFGPWQSARANFLFRSIERAAGRVTTHFVTVANAMSDQYLAAGIGSREQYTRIFSGFPLDPFLAARHDPELRRQFGLAPGDVVIGKIARLFELKGHDDLFEIMPGFVTRFPNARFLLIGGGPWESRFKQIVAATPALQGKVIFTGLVPPERIPALTGIMDLLVHLSLREGLPRALPQAMAAGKPVIAYDCDGAGEVCINGKTGILLPPRDKTALLNALSELAAKVELRERLGANGREFIRERFSVERMVEDTRELYLRLLRERRLLPQLAAA
jgi:glycosyltransferase involved in cell wall biosynthesis